MILNFNPLHVFKENPIYKENFLIWECIVYFSLAGDIKSLAFLDYLFILPGLIKFGLGKEYSSKSISQVLLDIIFCFLSIFTHLIALPLTIALLPFSYIAYKCLKYKGSQLKENILEIEVLPLDKEKLRELNYESDAYSLGDITREMSLSGRSLYNMFYGNNRHNRIKLKDYPDPGQFLEKNMEKYILWPIALELGEEKKDDSPVSSVILGLFPCRPCYCGMASSGHFVDIFDEVKGVPIALILPSKENREQMLSIERFDAFFLSCSWDDNGYLKDTIGEYLRRDDPLKQREQRLKRTIQFTLQQAANHAVQDTPMSDLHPAVDPLITTIIQFAGLGSLDSQDISFGNRFRQSIFYRTPVEPWIKKSSNSEFKSSSSLSVGR